MLPLKTKTQLTHRSCHCCCCCLCRLGLNLEAALDAAPAALTPPLLEAWLASERDREAAQWAPRRAEAPGGDADEDSEEEEEEEGAEHRTAAWRDVRRLLWRLGEPPVRGGTNSGQTSSQIRRPLHCCCAAAERTARCICLLTAAAHPSRPTALHNPPCRV